MLFVRLFVVVTVLLLLFFFFFFFFLSFFFFYSFVCLCRGFTAKSPSGTMLSAISLPNHTLLGRLSPLSG